MHTDDFVPDQTCPACDEPAVRDEPMFGQLP